MYIYIKHFEGKYYEKGKIIKHSFSNEYETYSNYTPSEKSC